MNKVSYWIKAARPQTLTASIAPVIVCSLYSYKYYFFNISVFIATLIAAILIQIITNFINDLYDSKKGADSLNRIGPDRMVQKGLISEIEIKNAIIFLLFLSTLVGLYLVIIGGLPILIIGLSAFIFAYLYTATPFAIAYNGLGEFFVFIYFGLIASIGTFYLQNLFYSSDIFIIGCILGLLNSSMLIVNNLRDIDNDKIANKKTLVVLLGKNFGKIELFFTIFLPYVLVFYLTKTQVSIFFFILFLFVLKIFLNTINNKSFLNKKALPSLSLHIIIFSTLLILFI